MCPPIIDITNSPKLSEKHIMFPLGGLAGPPLREIEKIDEIFDTFRHFNAQNLIKKMCSAATPKRPFTHCLGISS